MIRCRHAPVPAVGIRPLGGILALRIVGQPIRHNRHRRRKPARANPGPLGFAPGSAPRQLEAEADALAVPTPENARAWLRTLTEEPHVAGTPADHKTAVFVRDKLREWGWKADLSPSTRSCSTTRPGHRRRCSSVRPDRPRSWTLDETPIAADKDSASPDAFPAFHGYGVSGDVTGQVVYANYGRPEDFAALEKLGVDVKGKIVLVRYGELFRGLKVRNAQKRGREGILIYSDPADDGYAKGDVYPERPVPPRLGHPARERAVPLARAGRPLDPERPVDQGGEAAPDRPRVTASRQSSRRGSDARSDRDGRLGHGLGEGDRPGPRRLLRDHPLAADQLRRGPADPRGARRARTCPPGWQGGLPLRLPRRARARPRSASRSAWTTRSGRSGT